MKKILGALVCMLTLAGGAMEAKADLITNWTYNLSSTSLSNFNTDFVTVTTDGYGNDQASFDSGKFSATLSSENKSATGDLIFTGPGTSASSADDNKLLGQATVDNTNDTTTPATKLADLSFSYSVVGYDADGDAVSMNITYTIPLYTFYDSVAQTAYVYYINSEVGTTGASAITHDGYKYGITGVGLFVDGRAIENFTGAEDDPNLYSGWAINADTMKNNYSKYVVGGDNSEFYLGEKTGENDEVGFGEYSITGIFSIANSEVETPPAPTPEPATMLLMGAGLVGLGLVARRRNSK